MTTVKEADKKSEKEVVVTGFWPMFSTELYQSYRPCQIVAMNAAWHRAVPFLPKSWINHSAVKEWREAMESFREVSTQAEP